MNDKKESKRKVDMAALEILAYGAEYEDCQYNSSTFLIKVWRAIKDVTIGDLEDLEEDKL